MKNEQKTKKKLEFLVLQQNGKKCLLIFRKEFSTKKNVLDVSKVNVNVNSKMLVQNKKKLNKFKGMIQKTSWRFNVRRIIVADIVDRKIECMIASITNKKSKISKEILCPNIKF